MQSRSGNMLLRMNEFAEELLVPLLPPPLLIHHP
jgi:hypothetical protein